MKSLGIAFTLLLIFSSCKNDYSNLIGYWSLVDVELEDNASERLKNNLEKRRLEVKKSKGFMNFLDENKFLMGDESLPKKSEFEYKIENNSLVFDEREGEMNMEIISLNETTLKIKPNRTANSEHVTILVFKKQEPRQ